MLHVLPKILVIKGTCFELFLITSNRLLGIYQNLPAQRKTQCTSWEYPDHSQTRKLKHNLPGNHNLKSIYILVVLDPPPGHSQSLTPNLFPSMMLLLLFKPQFSVKMEVTVSNFLATEGSNCLCFSSLVGLVWFRTGQFVFHSYKGLLGHSQWNIDYILEPVF